MQEFEGRTAVITGAGSGIGRGLATVFARAGMRVVVSDIEEPAAAETVHLVRSRRRSGHRRAHRRGGL